MRTDKNLTPWTTRDSDNFEFCLSVGFAFVGALVLIGLGILAGLS